jgi:hypothetical protein
MVPEEISMKRMAQVKTRHRGDTVKGVPSVGRRSLELRKVYRLTKGT